VRGNASADKTFICLTSETFRSWRCKVYLSNGQKIAELENAYIVERGNKTIKAPYPFGFVPTFHRYRLREPEATKTPKTVFVGSMTDLFGDWVPDEWIQEVFAACAAAPQHRYLFLTKNPERYVMMGELGLLPEHKNFWYGTTVTDDEAPLFWSELHNTFLSIEPILAPFIGSVRNKADWVIIGAETGNRKGKVIPRREWIDNIVANCREAGIPVFMKESLRGLMGSEFVQEYPWERTE
jgi:protein gp37